MSCSLPVAPARIDQTAPPSPREEDAKQRVENNYCSGWLAPLFPGVGQLCYRKKKEGALLGGFSAGMLITGVSILKSTDVGHPARSIASDFIIRTWAYSITDTFIDYQKSKNLLFAPQDSLKEVVAAPLNLTILKKPEVWGGLLGGLATAYALMYSTKRGLSSGPKTPINIYGKDFSPWAGYPMGYPIFAFETVPVAVGEETVFRGFLQSTVSRYWGENVGHVSASAFFGAVHIGNYKHADGSLDGKKIATYIPYLTLLGAWFGVEYRMNQYSLAPSIAHHFWHNMILNLVSFTVNPSDFNAEFFIPF